MLYIIAPQISYDGKMSFIIPKQFSSIFLVKSKKYVLILMEVQLPYNFHHV